MRININWLPHWPSGHGKVPSDVFLSDSIGPRNTTISTLFLRALLPDSRKTGRVIARFCRALVSMYDIWPIPLISKLDCTFLRRLLILILIRVLLLIKSLLRRILGVHVLLGCIYLALGPLDIIIRIRILCRFFWNNSICVVNWSDF